MPHISIKFADEDATEAWPDLAAKQRAGQVEFVEHLNVAIYQEAMVSGAPSACFRFDLENGNSIIAQVTVRNLMQLQAAIKGRLEFLGIDENGKPVSPPKPHSN